MTPRRRILIGCLLALGVPVLAPGAALAEVDFTFERKATEERDELIVTSDDEGDQILIDCDQSGQVRVNGEVVPALCLEVEAVTVRGRGGQDEVDLSAITPDHFTDADLASRSIGVVGGDGSDELQGSPFADSMGAVAGKGDSAQDVIVGAGGRDKLAGGSGPDLLLGGAAADLALGGRGRDIVRGGAGPDVLRGGGDPDELIGGADHDRLLGEAGRDVLRGRSGNDRLKGGAGSDRLLGGRGRDLLSGGGGRDLLIGGPGRDRLVGRPENDTKIQ
jgi:Ca2+-binding RTX toxin-like protein